MSSASVTNRMQVLTRRSILAASSKSSESISSVAARNSATASFSHNSLDWCTTVNSSSSRCARCSGGFCNASSSSVRRYRS